jgi:hypothetical protein
MTSTSEYSRIFDNGIDFAVNAINEHCNTNFKSLAEAIIAIQALKDAPRPKAGTWVPLHAEPPEWNVGGHLND